eukprot:gene15057-16610_t
MLQLILDTVADAISREESEEKIAAAKQNRQRSSTMNVVPRGVVTEPRGDNLLPRGRAESIPESSEAVKFHDESNSTPMFSRHYSHENTNGIVCGDEGVPQTVSRHLSQLSLSCTTSGVTDNTVTKQYLDTNALRLSRMLQDTMQFVTKEFKWELYNIRSCLWNTKNSDLYLCVDTSVFPVHKSVLSLHSLVFHDVIYRACKAGVQDQAMPMIQLSGYDVEDVRELLICFYYPNRELRGDTLDRILSLAKTFKAHELLRICEDWLIFKNHADKTYSYDVYTLLGLAETYCFKRLHAQILKEAVSIEKVHEDSRFSELTEVDRRAIMLGMVKKRLLTVNEALERSKSMELINNVNNNVDTENDENYSPRDRQFSLRN